MMKLRSGAVLMMGFAFTLGLFLGLVLQLPGVSIHNSPSSPRWRPIDPYNAKLNYHKRNDDQPSGMLYSRTSDSDRLRSEGFGSIEPLDALKRLPQRDLLVNRERRSWSRKNVDDTSDKLENNRRSFLINEFKHSQVIKDQNQLESLEISSPAEGFNTHDVTDDASVNNYVNSAGNIEKVEGVSDDGLAKADKFKVVQYMKIYGSNKLPPERTKQHSPSEPKKMPYSDKLSDIVSGVLWADAIERIIPAGFSKDDTLAWRAVVANGSVSRMVEGTDCGRMQNRRIWYSDGQSACARYRINMEQLQGEIFSFYLSRLLGINHVPPAVMTTVDSKIDKWSNVRNDIDSAQWSRDKPVIISQWVNNLTPAFIPSEFQHNDSSLIPANLLTTKSSSELVELAQWSDLVIFDYLTANVDRVVNNMFNRQWNPDMMQSPAHNLETSTKNNFLVFIDNELGLLHSYRLLDRYDHFHEHLLASVCIFRRRTVKQIESLHKQKNIALLLRTLFEQSEKLHNMVPFIPNKNLSILQNRIDKVYKQIQSCKTKYHT
ncbi:unnamed protein product [Owenia fusiformis]|uniref:Uncharacterized protein n=1 Tax=Owenia fusiformis TaxID=6347 RepID=A0A8J1TFG2_OWEFU|nr:unnamed protein product [Owenia fusiformis]